MITWHLLLLLLNSVTVWTVNPYDDKDLITYKTLPQHRVLKWSITYHDRSRVAPGYWFVAPYFKFGGEQFTNRWMPCQVGPYIFDQDGELVWAGACDYPNRNAYDLRVVDTLGNMPHISWQMHSPFEGSPDPGLAVIYNNHYEPIYEIRRVFNQDMHEFWVKEPPLALTIIAHGEMRSLAEFGDPGRVVGTDTFGFGEINIKTGKFQTEWYPDQIPISESFIADPNGPEPGFDYLHPNSIDKNDDGDFLFSGRHTDTIYLIDGQNKNIKWRFGGKHNDFQMDFEFHRQHDAKFISSNSTHVVLSLLNNGADNHVMIQPTSAGIYVELDLVTRRAKLLNRYPRPDGKSSDARGNMQTLPNQNVLMSWALSAYMSEYSHDGTCLMEARFASDRFDTYRAYKFPWVGRPKWPPTLMASCNAVNGSEGTTTFHVSWNGATDIAYWRFYSGEGSRRTEIATVPKKGFETAYIAKGYMGMVSVEALSIEYEVMGVSKVQKTTLPEYWPEGAPLLKPSDPNPPNDTNIKAVSEDPVHLVASYRNSIIWPLLGCFLAGSLISAAICIFFFKPSVSRYVSRYTRLWDNEEGEEGKEEELNPLAREFYRQPA